MDLGAVFEDQPVEFVTRAEAVGRDLALEGRELLGVVDRGLRQRGAAHEQTGGAQQDKTHRRTPMGV